MHHPGVLGNAALEHHGRGDLLALAHVVQVVAGHSVAEPRDDVLARVAHLDLVHEIALGEHGAARGDVGRLGGSERDVAELLYLHAQAVRLRRQKRAGARGAQGVHGVVHRDAIGHADDLGILAADLQNGAHVRVQMGGAHGMGGDLVLDHGSPQHGPHETPRAARRASADDIHPRAFHLALQLAHDVLRRLGRVALGPQIRPRDNGAILVDDHALRGNGADVDAEITLCHLLFSFFMESMS